MLPDLKNDLRSKPRPDILRVNGLPFDNVRPPQSLSKRGSLQTEIVEVGYCSDTRWEAKLEEETLQHAQLVYLQNGKQNGKLQSHTSYHRMIFWSFGNYYPAYGSHSTTTWLNMQRRACMPVESTYVHGTMAR